MCDIPCLFPVGPGATLRFPRTFKRAFRTEVGLPSPCFALLLNTALKAREPNRSFGLWGGGLRAPPPPVHAVSRIARNDESRRWRRRRPSVADVGCADFARDNYLLERHVSNLCFVYVRDIDIPWNDESQPLHMPSSLARRLHEISTTCSDAAIQHTRYLQPPTSTTAA